MLLSLFIEGLVIGFCIAAPVGPIGILCIRRALLHGRTVGFVSGMGAATADSLYGAVAAFGVTAVSALLIAQQRPLELVGGVFLICLGIRFFLHTPDTVSPEIILRDNTLLRAYTSTLALTLTNPATIFSFAAVFAALGLGSVAKQGIAPGMLMVAGVFLGSCAWWLLLSEIVHALRSRVSVDSLGWANKAAGVMIVLFGIAALAKGVF